MDRLFLKLLLELNINLRNALLASEHAPIETYEAVH